MTAVYGGGRLMVKLCIVTGRFFLGFSLLRKIRLSLNGRFVGVLTLMSVINTENIRQDKILGKMA